MPTATDFDAKLALKDVIAGIETIADAFVQQGVPLHVPTETERVYILDGTEDGRREPELQSRIWRETYKLQVLIEVKVFGADERAATAERMRDVRNAIEDALDEDDTLAGTVKQAAVRAWESEVGASADDDGWIGKTLLTIEAGAIVA